MKYETTTSLREKEELKECTFRPKINKIELTNNNFKENSVDTFTRLYTDHERYSKKKLIKSLQKNFIDSQISSFTPNISLSNYKINKSFSFKPEKFFDRLNKVIKNTTYYIL